MDDLHRAEREERGRGVYKRTGATDVPRNYVNVGKIDKHIEAFKNAGGREVVGKMEVPTMGWSFIGTDPEGNLTALFETKAAPRRTTKRKKN